LKSVLIAAALRFFLDSGYAAHTACGIVGNLVAESEMSPTLLDDGGTSYGLAQWHLERWDALKAFAKKAGKESSDFRLQLEFIQYELQTEETLAREALKSAKNIREATLAFLHFERPRNYSETNPERSLHFSERFFHAREACAEGIEP
jgi:hypothetical protein